MTLIYFIIVLCVTIMIHEFGHFLFAKKAGVHVYEFSLGMGPQLFKFHRKNDETMYSIRLLPIGGYVSMAGEDMEDGNNIPKEKQMCNKKWYQRFSILVAGVVFNFLLAIVLFWIIALCNGVPATKPYIQVESLDSTYPISKTTLQDHDRITHINGKKVNSVDRLALELQVHGKGPIEITVKHQNGDMETVQVAPKEITQDGTTTYQYGISILPEKDQGFVSTIRYAFVKTGSLVEQMSMVIGYLVTGKLSLSNLAGPIGIYNIVGKSAEAGFMNILFLIAYLCINVGLINLIPLPAFDGGRLLFLIIEKIKGSRVSPNIENAIHSVGFVLLMILMIVVSYNDVIRLFH